MTKKETNTWDTDHLPIKRLAAAFITLLICYAAGALLAFFAAPSLCTESYYVSCPLPDLSVYGVLSSVSVYLKSSVCQLLVVFFSVFTFVPSLAASFVALYRGICTGVALFSVSQGLVMGSGSPKAAVSLYFLASVLFLLLGSFVFHTKLSRNV